MAAARRRVTSQGRRQDPRGRHVEGWGPWNSLVNKDPGKQYVWAYMNHPETGVEKYASQSFEPVIFEGEHGTRPAGGTTCKIGEPIQMRGHMLMSVPVEIAEYIDAHGENGDTGQERCNRIEQMIIDRRNGVVDTLRGMGVAVRRVDLDNDYFHLENETKPTETGMAPNLI